MKFYELAVGSRFFHVGQRFEKVTVSVAQDEQGIGYVFLAGTQVESDDEPIQHPPAEAAIWESSATYWTAHPGPAPWRRAESD